MNLVFVISKLQMAWGWGNLKQPHFQVKELKARELSKLPPQYSAEPRVEWNSFSWPYVPVGENSHWYRKGNRNYFLTFSLRPAKAALKSVNVWKVKSLQLGQGTPKMTILLFRFPFFSALGLAAFLTYTSLSKKLQIFPKIFIWHIFLWDLPGQKSIFICDLHL